MTQEKATVGIKETMDAVALVSVVAVFVAKELRADGLQLTDAVVLLTKPDFQSRLIEAVSGISQVPGEVADLSAYEVLDLSEYVLKTVRTVVDVFAGKRAA
jgi:hypothetical protein